MADPDRSRRSWLGWVRDVVGHSYRERGLLGMVAQGPRFLWEDLLAERLRWWLLTRPVYTDRIDRTELRERAARSGRLWEGPPVETVTIDAPDGVSVPPALGAVTGTAQPAQSFVAEMRDVRVVGDRAVGFLDDRVVFETASASEMYLHFALCDLYDRLATDRDPLAAYRTFRAVCDGRAVLRSAESPIDDPPSTAAALIPNWRSFYHWVIEFLPKLRLLERYEQATGRRPALLIKPDPPQWMVETLELAGWGDDLVEWRWAGGRVDRLVVPTHRNQFLATHDSRFGDDFDPAPQDVRWLADRMRSNVSDLDPDRFSDRVFVSRRDSSRRPVADEAAVVEALEPLGFESYALASLSVADQIRLFAGAEVVVGPHGAGLVNQIYAEECALFELFPEQTVRPYYFSLARQLGFDYDCAVYPTHGEALVVDTDDLRRRVARFIERQ